jgi:hypothetical protein
MQETAGRKIVMTGFGRPVRRSLAFAAVPYEAQRVLVKRAGELAATIRGTEQYRRVKAWQRDLHQQRDRSKKPTEIVRSSPAARPAPMTRAAALITKGCQRCRNR